MTNLFNHFKKFTHSVEIPCKTLFKPLCKSCEHSCVKLTSLLPSCVKLPFSTNFSQLSHRLFLHHFSPIFNQLIHLSTNPTITTTIYIIK